MVLVVVSRALLRSSRVCATLIALGGLGASNELPSVEYVFTLDGRRLEPEIEHVGTRGPRPGIGDLVRVDDYRMVLGAPGAYACFKERRDRLVLRSENGVRTVVAVTIDGADDLTRLEPADWASLRSVVITNWPEGLEAELAHIDPAQCVVDLRGSKVSDYASELPETLQFLACDVEGDFDANRLARLGRLKYLRVYGADSLENMGRLKDARDLRYLDLSASQVSSLRPLNGHVSLNRIVANCSPVKELPSERLPSLMRVDLLASGCPAEELERFEGMQENVHVIATFRDALMHRIQETTTVRVRTGSVCHPRPDDHLLFSTSREEECAELMKLLHFDDDYSPPRVIPGCGEFTIQFLGEGEALLAEVELLGDKVARYSMHWPVPTRLSSTTAAPFQQWMKARGVALRRD